jgi:hypothetical protein
VVTELKKVLREKRKEVDRGKGKGKEVRDGEKEKKIIPERSYNL